MANDLQHHRVGEADHRNDGHRQEKVVDVAAELEVNWLGEKDRLHQLALGRLEVRPYDNRPRAFSGPELADLYDGRTAEENVAAVASVVVQLVLAVSKGRLGDGAALAGEHRLVDDHLAGEEDRVKVQLAAKTQKISINLFKNYPKKEDNYLPALEDDHIAGHQVAGVDAPLFNNSTFFLSSTNQNLTTSGHLVP